VHPQHLFSLIYFEEAPKLVLPIDHIGFEVLLRFFVSLYLFLCFFQGWNRLLQGIAALGAPQEIPQ